MLRHAHLALIAALGLVAGPAAGAGDLGCPAAAFMDVSGTEGAGEGYPRPRLEVSCDENALVVSSNAIPHYEFVPMTPNPLVELNRDYRMPLRPALAEEPSPLPLLGPSGVAINGIPLFGPNEGPVPRPGFGDPVYNEIMDACMGHTARQYHYHALVQACLASGAKAGEPSPILAFAFDGFPIYGPFGCSGEDCSAVVEYKSSWIRLRAPEIDAWQAYRFEPQASSEYLDRCNGHSGDDHGGAYHYHATATWPYILGCYSGTPSAASGRAGDRQAGGRGGPPPAEDPRPSKERLAAAAVALGIEEERLAAALGLTDGQVIPMNYVSSARALGVDYRDLSAALGVEPQQPPGRRGRPRGPQGRRPRPGPGPRPRR